MVPKKWDLFMGVSWEIHGSFKGFYRWWGIVEGEFFHGDEWLMWFMVSIKSAASQRFDSKKYEWKYEGPGQRNAYFRLLKTGRFPENLSFRPLLNRRSRAPLGCDLRGAACPELPWAKNGKPCIGSWRLGSSQHQRELEELEELKGEKWAQYMLG